MFPEFEPCPECGGSGTTPGCRGCDTWICSECRAPSNMGDCPACGGTGAK